MEHQIKTMYVVQHSHTDIGYTDLQEVIIDSQTASIRKAMELLRRPENKAFRWNCETYYCVEKFLSEATAAEKEEFFALIKNGQIGVSASYLNFCDLVPSDILKERIAEMCRIYGEYGISVKTAMTADINGISLGQRNALIDNGVEFLFTNIHTHHGMYPLYRNQNAYRWERADGKSLLVWNGEHYNLGNVLGIKPNRPNPGTEINYMVKKYVGAPKRDDPVEILADSLEHYITECETEGYEYDFIVTGVSGVFSDNAPPYDDILRIIEKYNAKNTGVTLKMVTLQELYEEIADKLSDVPTLHGDLNDWWGNGVGSTPYTVKHYREGLRTYRLAEKLMPSIYEKYPEISRLAQDNFLLYAEHTWGYSASVTNPYDTMVYNLDLRKSSYASKAHEAATLLKNRAVTALGGALQYYETEGKLRAVNTADISRTLPVEFYVENPFVKAVSLKTSDGEEKTVQVAAHPRGVKATFIDEFKAGEIREYTFKEIPADEELLNTRHPYVGGESVRDMVNSFDTESYRLPYEMENDFFIIKYEIGRGFTALIDKRTGKDLAQGSPYPLFTPLYEVTELRKGAYEERRLLGRNIRGCHAVLHTGKLTDVEITDRGEVFVQAKFRFELKGMRDCYVKIKLYRSLPRIEYTLQTAKELSDDIESVFMPQTFDRNGGELWFKKGEEAFRPGIDQLPGSGMEYSMTDDGAAVCTENGSVLIAAPDTPLMYMGEMKSHPVKLCDSAPENNRRPLYSWVMNNTWETNFKIDLSGFGEFSYRFELTDETNPEACFKLLSEEPNAVAFIVK